MLSLAYQLLNDVTHPMPQNEFSRDCDGQIVSKVTRTSNLFNASGATERLTPNRELTAPMAAAVLGEPSSTARGPASAGRLTTPTPSNTIAAAHHNAVHCRIDSLGRMFVLPHLP